MHRASIRMKSSSFKLNVEVITTSESKIFTFSMKFTTVFALVFSVSTQHCCHPATAQAFLCAHEHQLSIWFVLFDGKLLSIHSFCVDVHWFAFISYSFYETQESFRVEGKRNNGNRIWIEVLDGIGKVLQIISGERESESNEYFENRQLFLCSQFYWKSFFDC